MNPTQPIGPGVVDLAAHVEAKNAPKPVASGQIVVQTFSLPGDAMLTAEVGLGGGRFPDGREFVLAMGGAGTELYLIRKDRDHRVIATQHILDAWFAQLGEATIGLEHPEQVDQVEAARIALVDVMRLTSVDQHDDALTRCDDALTHLEEALRLAHDMRVVITQHTTPDPVTQRIDADRVAATADEAPITTPGGAS